MYGFWTSSSGNDTITTMVTGIETTGGTSNWAAGGSSKSLNTYYSLGGTWEWLSGTNIQRRWYINGKLDFAGTNASYAHIYDGPCTKFLIGNTWQWNEGAEDTVIEYLYIWDRVLKPEEFARIYSNPYCFIGHDTRRRVFIISGTTGFKNLSSGAALLLTAGPSLSSGTALLVTAGPALDSGAGLLATTGPDLATGVRLIETAGPALSTGVKILATAGPDLSTGAKILLEATLDLPTGAAIVSSGTGSIDLPSGAGLLATAGPDLSTGAALLVTAGPALDSGAKILATSGPALSTGARVAETAGPSLSSGAAIRSGFFAVRSYSLALSIADAVADKSGMDYRPDESLVYSILNTHYIRRFRRDGSLYGSCGPFTPTPSIWDDTEALSWLGATGGPYGGATWAALNEGDESDYSVEVVFFNLTKDESTPTNVTNKHLSSIPRDAVGGAEGLTYDLDADQFYVSNQSCKNVTGIGLWRTSTRANDYGTQTLLWKWYDKLVTTGEVPSDAWVVGDITHGRVVNRPDSIFVLVSDMATNAKILEISLSSGAVLSRLTVAGNKTEGICFDPKPPYELFLCADNAGGNNFWRYDNSPGTNTKDLSSGARLLATEGPALSTGAKILAMEGPAIPSGVKLLFDLTKALPSGAAIVTAGTGTLNLPSGVALVVGGIQLSSGARLAGTAGPALSSGTRITTETGQPDAGGMKFWFGGLPLPGLEVEGLDLGEVEIWEAGLPVDLLFPDETEIAIDYADPWFYSYDNSDKYTAGFYGDAYEPTGWSSGAGFIGFGTIDSPPADAVMRTVLTPPGDNRSLYLRREFVIRDASRLSRVQIQAMRDDAVVIWVNGVEVGRGGVSDPLSHGKVVSAWSPEGEPLSLDLTTGLQLAPFRTGMNSIAIMGFQAGAASTDLGIGAKVILTFSGAALNLPAGARITGDATLALPSGAEVLGAAPDTLDLPSGAHVLGAGGPALEAGAGLLAALGPALATGLKLLLDVGKALAQGVRVLGPAGPSLPAGARILGGAEKALPAGARVAVAGTSDLATGAKIGTSWAGLVEIPSGARMLATAGPALSSGAMISGMSVGIEIGEIVRFLAPLDERALFPVSVETTGRFPQVVEETIQFEQ